MSQQLSGRAFYLVLICVFSLCAVSIVGGRVDAQSSLPGPILPGDLPLCAAAGTQSSPQVAKGGSGSLVVWADTRTVLRGFASSIYNGPGLGTLADIYAARLDANGNLIDPTPIIISEAQYNQVSPLVAWNGQNWLVVWMTERETNRYYYDVMATRVAVDGRVLDNPPILVNSAETSINPYSPWNVSSDGVNWVIAWRGLNSTAGIFTIDGTRIAPDGTILDPGGKRLREDFWNSAPTNAHFAFAGDEYLLTWLELDGTTVEWVVKGERLSLALDTIGGPFTINQYNPSSTRAPSVASNGSSFLVVWFEDRYYGFAQLFGSRVSHTGQVLDPQGIPITPSAGYTQFAPAVSWDGANYFVAYNKQATGFDDDIFATRVSPAGAVLDPDGILVKGGPGAQLQPAITQTAIGGARVVWVDSQAGGSDPEDIYSAAVTASGAVGQSAAISLGAPRQSRPRLVAGGNGFLAVFQSERSGESRILAQRLDASGTPIDLEPITLASGSPSLTNPSVAWNGSIFLVIWQDGSANAFRGQIYGRRVAPDGTLLDGSAISIMPGSRPDVSALGTSFLVAADDAPSNPHFRFVFAARVSAAGAVLDSPVGIGGSYGVSPRVASIGGRWLVVWESHPTHDSSYSAILGIFVNADISHSSVFGVSDGGFDATPSLAVAGGSALIVWAEADIFGRRILADGTLMDSAGGTVISGAANNQYVPSVAWDGTQYLVDWLDQRNDTYPSQPRGDIYATRVGSDGTVLDPGGIAVANSPLPEETPSVAALNGTTVLAYAAFNDHAPFAAFRITLRRFPFDIDYSISATPGAQTIAPGGSTSFTVNVAPVGGASRTVSFSAFGLPPGVVASFSPATVTGSGFSTLTLTSSVRTVEEIYTLTIIGASGAQQSTTQVTLVVANNPAAVRFTVTDLGTLGGTSSEAWGINDSGQVVGFSTITGGAGPHAFLYSGGAKLDLGTLGGAKSYAYSINNSGQVAGYSTTASSVNRAFRYTGGVMQALSTFDNGDSEHAWGFGINNSGQVVGGSEFGNRAGPHAFIYNGAALTDLGSLGGYWSYAFDINTSGQVAGHASNTIGYSRAFLYSGGVMQDLGTLNGASADSYAYGLNDSAQVVGGSTYTNNTTTHAVLYSGGLVRDLGTLGGTESLARAINNSGQVVGYATNAGEVHRAFLYEGTLINLNTLIAAGSGWDLTEAYGINNAGLIVGKGVINGQTHAFLLTPTGTGATCSYAISPANQSFGMSGGGGSVSVTAPGGCTWNAVTNNAWIMITSVDTGSGSDVVTYELRENFAAGSRTGTITIAGLTFTVVQDGASTQCTYSLSSTLVSTTSAGGVGSVGVTAPSGCSWSAISNASWVSITSGSSGVGNLTVTYLVASNTGPTRIGTLKIAGQIFTVKQKAKR